MNAKVFMIASLGEPSCDKGATMEVQWNTILENAEKVGTKPIYYYIQKYLFCKDNLFSWMV